MVPTRSAFVSQLDFAQPFLGRAFGDEVEHARWIGGTKRGAAKSVDDLDLFVFFERRGRGDRDSHPVLAVVLHVAALHAASLGTQNLGPLHLLE